MIDKSAEYLMFTSGIIATLFIAYAVILLDLPMTFRKDWRRAVVLPPALRRRVRLGAGSSVAAMWGAALLPGLVLLSNLVVLGEQVTGAGGSVPVDGLISEQVAGIGVLLLYILGHRLMLTSDFDRAVAKLRRKRRKRADAVREGIQSASVVKQSIDESRVVR